MAAKPPSRNVAAQIEVSQVPEPYARKNFQNIKKFLDEETPLNGFRFVEFRIAEAQEDFKFHHNLGYVPRDFVITRISGAGTATLNYDKFDAETISVTVTAPCYIRGFLGTYAKDISSDQTGSNPQPMSFYTNPTGALVSEPVGSTTTIINTTTVNPTTTTVTPIQVAVIRDQKPSGTSGGTFTAGAYNTRDLNTIDDPSGFVALLSNQFTLQAGTYRISASAPVYEVNEHKIRIRNITDSTDAALGTSEYCGAGDNTSNRSLANAIFTILDTKTFEIQHRCGTTKATVGYGIANALGVEVYTVVEIMKIN